jgi:fluoroquinolone transport system permease protein
MGSVWLDVLRADAKRVFRDRFLLLIVTYLPLMALAFRWAIPALAEKLQGRVDISLYYPVLCATIVLILPYIMGCVLGLQLLEEKDEGSLNAVAVTRFSFRRYFFFRVGIYAAIGALMLVVSHQAMGIVRSISLFQLVIVAVAFAFNTSLSAFIISILAKNQVQGFAVLKGSGALFIGPVLSFFVPQHWDLLFGVIPFYWPIKAYYVAVAGGSNAVFWGAIVMAIVTQLVALSFLYRLFQQRILRA